MKRLRPPVRLLWLATAALLLLCGRSLAQPTPIVITTIVTPPYSPVLSDWEASPGRVLITVQNTDPANGYTIRLSGFAERTDGGVRIETKDDFPVPAITLGPSETRMLNLSDFRLFQVGAVRFIGTSAGQIARTGLLPEGSYRVCVRALDYKTLAPLSAAAPSGCSSFSVRYAEEPAPLLPSCATTITARDPQLINFQWTPGVGAPPGTQYQFTMAEIVPPARTPDDAIRAGTTPPFFQRTVAATMLSYGPADPALVRGRSYAWRVQAVDPSGARPFRNQGYSQTCSFTYGGPAKTDSIPAYKDKKLPPKTDSIPQYKKDIEIGGFKDIPSGKFTMECLNLTAGTDYTPAGTPRFFVEVDPAINLNAVKGGRIEIWRTTSRLEKPFEVSGDKSRLVFSKEFTGNSERDIRPGQFKNSNVLELKFAEGAFTPKAQEDYMWQFTLQYDPAGIRKDGMACSRSSAASNYGYFPPIFRAKNLPDTLVDGEFRIVVEEWDAKSRSRNPALPSGVGRIKFNCNAPSIGWLPWLEGAKLKLKDFTVVGSVMDSAAHLSLPEARAIDASAMLGDKMSLTFPADYSTKTQVISARNYLIDFYGVKKKAVDGIRVFFRDVRWAGPVQPTVVLTEGLATYPSDPPVPTPPAQVMLDSGMTLAIDSLTLTPTEATVIGAVWLPKNVISAEVCTRAMVKLPSTRIHANCEFYREVPDSAYGPYFVGNTDIEIKGTGYVIDFSASQSAPGVLPALANTWKGVVLRAGRSVARYGTADSIISNRGYVYADYVYPHALVTAPGLAANLKLNAPFTYQTLEPFGYEMRLGTGNVLLAASAVSGGSFTTPEIVLPASVYDPLSGATRIKALCAALTVQPDMDLYGDVRVKGSIAWGIPKPIALAQQYYQLMDPGSAPDMNGGFYTAARYKASYYPLDDTNFKAPTMAALPTDLEAQSVQGVTLPVIAGRNLVVLTKDIPTSSADVRFDREHVGGWMNFARAGVNSGLRIIRPGYLPPVELGPKDLTSYKGGVPFKVLWGKSKDKKQESVPMTVSFTESAVYASGLYGQLDIQGPIKALIDFDRMMFTSVAHNAGGQVRITQPDTMDYWGVQLVAKDTTKSAGIACVKLGVIYLTAAGIAEPQHYAKPFYLTWGEVMASGDLGELVFDYNTVGQRFDRFLFTPAMVKLSPYDPAARGYLHTFGGVSVGFWGAKKMSISDFKDPTLVSPYFGRRVIVRDTAHMGAEASQLNWNRNWAANLARFDFRVGYDSAHQDGFVGDGHVNINGFAGDMSATIRVRAEGSCFSVIHNSAVDFSLGPVARFGAMATVWGCGCVHGDALERIAVGGELSNSFGLGASIAAQGSNMVSTIFSISPSQLVMEMNGEMFLRIGDLASVNTSITGMASFTFNYAEGFVEGYLKGRLNMGAFFGIPAAAQVSATIMAEGELDWHLGLDYQAVQGRVAVSIYGMAMAPITAAAGVPPFGAGASAGIEAGVFVGNNVPKGKVWVMDGINGRFGLNKNSLPDRLFGFYAYVGVRASVSIFILSGGFELYTGIGSFVGYGGVPGFGMIANVGVKLWGSFLGGLLSASVWGQLQAVAGIPPAFQGTLGVEACALWVLCVSAEVNAGFNANQGFFLY